MKKINLKEQIDRINEINFSLNEAPSQVGFAPMIRSFIAKIGTKVLDITVVREFKPLVDRGILKIEDGFIKKINWESMSFLDLKLFFRSKTAREVLEKVFLEIGVDVNDPIVLQTLAGRQRQIVKAYQESADDIIVPSLKDSFKTGFKTTVKLKDVLTYMTFNQMSKFSSKFKKLNADEMKTMHLWFFSGVGNKTQIQTIFKSHGYGDAFIHSAAAVSGQWFRKWIFWSLTFTVCNILIDILKDFGKDEEVYDETWKAIVGRAWEGATFAGFKWVVPIVSMIKIISPILLLGGGKNKVGDLIKKLEKQREKANAEIRNVESTTQEEKDEMIKSTETTNKGTKGILNVPKK